MSQLTLFTESLDSQPAPAAETEAFSCREVFRRGPVPTDGEGAPPQTTVRARTQPEGSDRLVFTIGHSNHPFERFVELLALHSIQLLIDTRSQPVSRFAPQFNREALHRALSQRGIQYLFLGRELGGRPRGAEYYDARGNVDYARVAASAAFQHGMQRLERWINRRRVALLCSEEDPRDCHRRLLIGRVLRKQGVAVQHIRADGRLEADAADADVAQPGLFSDEETGAWKSIRSVLRKKLRMSSSGHSVAPESSD